MVKRKVLENVHPEGKYIDNAVTSANSVVLSAVLVFCYRFIAVVV